MVGGLPAQFLGRKPMVLLKKFAWVICIFLPLFAGAQRLPYGLSAKHYGLTLTPDLKKAAFSGNATLDVEVNKAASAFTLNAIELKFQKATITQNNKTQITK
jgi:hypothetical protein